MIPPIEDSVFGLSAQSVYDTIYSRSNNPILQIEETFMGNIILSPTASNKLFFGSATLTYTDATKSQPPIGIGNIDIDGGTFPIPYAILDVLPMIGVQLINYALIQFFNQTATIIVLSIINQPVSYDVKIFKSNSLF